MRGDIVEYSNSVISITDLQLALTLILVAAAGAITAWLRLGLWKNLSLGTFRMFVQLFLIGYLLRYIFELRNFWAICFIVIIMSAMASHTASRRASAAPHYPRLLSFFSMLMTTYFITFRVCLFIVRDTPWYHPRILIPLAGMLLSNTMNGIALSVDRYFSEMKSHSHEVEGLLALGASPWEAALEPIRQALRTGMIPIINTMMVAGIVSIPGMMTGQILGGVDPVMAVRYQILIIMMIAAAVVIGSLILLLTTYKEAFTDDGALRPEILH